MSDWADTVKAMRRGEADIHSGLFLNKKRQEFLEFSQPVYQINSSFYHRRDTNLPEDPAQFGQRLVAVTTGSYQESALRQHYPEMNLVVYPSWKSALEALKERKVNAAMGEDLTMETLLDDLGWGGEISAVSTPLFSNVVYGAVAKGNEKLLKKMNEGLATLTEEEKNQMERIWVRNPERRIFDANVGTGSQHLTLTMEERAWLETHPDLRLGVDPSWPPYDFVDSHGKHAGLAADVLTRLRRMLGIEINLEPDLTWSQALKNAQARSLDVISFCTPTPDRAKYLLFSDPVVTVPWVIATRRNYKLKEGLQSLYGKKVLVAEGYGVIAPLRANHPDLAFTEVSHSPGGHEKSFPGPGGRLYRLFGSHHSPDPR